MALSGGDASRLLFAPDGTLFMSSSHHRDEKGPQDPMNDAGKILRLNDDGTIPKDNPFVGKAGYRPEIYSIGHRTVLGLTFHPTTGALWETENGPQGGDEVNIIQPGKNYGWPLVTYGHDYDGTPLNERPIPARDGVADGFLGAFNHHVRHHVLYRRQARGVEGQPLSWAP